MYAKLNNEQIDIYPYTIGQLRKDNPNVSFPKNISSETLASFNVVEVQLVSPPSVSDTQVWHEINPVLDSGVWKQAYSISNATQEEIEFRIASKSLNLRAARDKALADSDWTQVADAPVDQQAWATYRQALRDLPSNPEFPNVELPTEPGFVSGNSD